MTITLSDAPEEVINSSSRNLNLLVVHQQDIQAVANAMWKGGAEAMTIQGQRVITTTGIKCEGNAVMLQGVAYAQPYVISAIGNPAALEAAVLQDDYVAGYRAAAAVPDISVGWDMRTEERIEAPAYEGLTDHAVRRAARTEPAGRAQPPPRPVSVVSVGRTGEVVSVGDGDSVGVSLGVSLGSSRSPRRRS